MIFWINRDLSKGWYRIAFLNEVAKHMDVTLVTNVGQPDCVMKQIVVGNGTVLGQRYTDHEFANKSFAITLHRRLLRLMLSMKPELVICEGFFRWSLYALLLKIVRPRTKLVMLYERTDHTERNAQPIRTAYRKFFLRRCDLVICSGRASQKYVQRLNRRVATNVGHMCADSERFQCNPRETGLIKRLVYVGRLEERKGILQFLEAFVSVRPKHLTLDIVGEGRLKPELEALASDMSNVSFRSYISNESLPGFLKDFDVMVLPTLEDNWALVGFEAIAAGLAFATSTKNGASFEFISDEAIKFNPTKAGSIQRLLDRLDTMHPHQVDIIKAAGQRKGARHASAVVAVEFARNIDRLLRETT